MCVCVCVCVCGEMVYFCKKVKLTLRNTGYIEFGQNIQEQATSQ